MKILKLIFVVSILMGSYSTGTTYYVDSSVPSSGDGLSWATALKTISEAASKNLQPGDIVLIKPGTYSEQLNFTKSGSEIVPVTAGISIINGNRINFPTGTDLSYIDLINNPDQYYACVYRSYYSNNGYFKIISVNDAADYIEVDNASFINETGVSGNYDYLSFAIIRPIVFRKFSSDPINERVEVNLTTLPSAYTALYIGTYINQYDAYPCNYLIVDGIDLRSSQNGGGIHIQDSKHVIIANSKIYDMQETGIYINGNSTEPANYNIIISNEIYNTPYEGIYIGAGGQPAASNWTNYNHIIGNKIYTVGTSSNAKLENAIEVKEYNVGNVIESNIIRDFKLESSGNGAINLKGLSKKTLVYNNLIKNITKTSSNSGTNYIVNIEEKTEYSYFFNNLIYNITSYSDNVYALSAFGENTISNGIYNNTFYNINRGILLQYYKVGGNGTDINVSIKNNIFSNISNNLIEEWTSGSGDGNFSLSNNLFNSNPNNYYYPVSNDFIGNPNFSDPSNENFNLTAASTKVIDKGTSISDIPLNYDFSLESRTGLSDIGAYEYQELVPVELVSFVAEIKNDFVILKWQTATEMNNYGFEVEHASTSLSTLTSTSLSTLSTNLNNKGEGEEEAWEKIGFVAGSGNSNSPKDYLFVDKLKNLTSTSLRYRLKQIDTDGSYHYSPIVEVEIENIPTKFVLYQNYPNPFNPSTTIKFGLPKHTKVMLEVFNIIGEKVATLVNKELKAGYHKVEFIGNGLPSGVFIYRLETEEFTSMKKFVLLK